MRALRPAGEDHDAPKTVEDAIQHRTKVLLMKQFSWAAAVCVVCYVAALIVPLFYYSEPGEEDTAVLVVLILWNCVRWLFLAGLCFIFRYPPVTTLLKPNLCEEVNQGVAHVM